MNAFGQCSDPKLWLLLLPIFISGNWDTEEFIYLRAYIFLAWVSLKAEYETKGYVLKFY